MTTKERAPHPERTGVFAGVQFVTRNPASLPSALAALEKRLAGLPADLKAFLADINGGKPSVKRFRVGNSRSSVHYFYGVKTGAVYSDIDEALVTFTGRIPRRMVPVAADDGGNQVLLSTAPPDHGAVYFWDHEAEPDTDEEAEQGVNLKRIAGSFTEFVRSLEGAAPSVVAAASPPSSSASAGVARRATSRRQRNAAKGQGSDTKRTAKARTASRKPRSRG